MYDLGTWVDNWTFKVQVDPDNTYFLNILPSTTHPFFSIHKFFKKYPQTFFGASFTCFPMWLCLSPLYVLNSAFLVQKLFSYYFVQS